MQKHIWQGVSTLVGTIIGAGILAIPFVVQQAGFWTGILLLLVLGSVVTLLNLMLGEVALRTKGNHQLTGYAEKYLGAWGKRWMTLSMLVGIYGALLAYLLGVGTSLAQVFGGGSWLWSLGFFIIMASVVYLGLGAVEESESWLTPIKILLFIIILVMALMSPHFALSKLSDFSSTKLLIPYGVILFSLIGTVAIPEVKEETKKHWKDLKKTILIGSLIPIVVYILFIIIVLGTTGTETTPIATVGVGKLLGNVAVYLLNVFAILAMTTSFLALGLALKEMYCYDYHWNTTGAGIAALAVPFALWIFGLQNFIQVLGIAGAVAGGIDGVLIVIIHRNAKQTGKRTPEYSLRVPSIISVALIFIFVLGAIQVFL